MKDPIFLFLPRDFFNEVLPPLTDVAAMLPDRVPGPDSSCCFESASKTSSRLESSTSIFSTANSVGTTSLLGSHTALELTMSALF